MGRMNKRMSLAPSVIMATTEEPPEGHNAIKEFFISHIKTLVTIFMIFGTIAVIVVIVMVHKVKLAEQQDEHERACLDVAIVGAGISGTYAAWRLRNNGLKVSLFEVSDRIGGRVHTRHLAGLRDVNAELGAMYYLPQRHPLLNETILALDLLPVPLRPRKHDHTTYFLRGVRLRETELTNVKKLPYNLETEEQDMLPEELVRMYLTKAMSNESDLSSNLLKAKTKDGAHLYKHGFWNILGRVGSREGYNFLYDTAEWRSFLSNENAAILGAATTQDNERPMTIATGMDQIPIQMAHLFSNASDNHQVNLNWRLSCINKRQFHPGYNLVFVKTYTRGDVTKDLYRNHALTKQEVCTRRVVLALPPKAVKEVNWRDMENKWQLREDINSVEPVPALRVLFVYDRKLRGPNKNSHRITTDLPFRHAMYLGGRPRLGRAARRRSKIGRMEREDGVDTIEEVIEEPFAGPIPQARQPHEKHLYMVANLDAADTEYFTDMLAKIKSETQCNRSEDVVRHITGQLAKAYGMREEDIPTPETVIVKDWSKSPAGCGWYIWKKGVQVDKVMNRMIKPLRRENIFIVGSTFCGGECQLWIEGAMKTVDTLLKWYFHMR